MPPGKLDTGKIVGLVLSVAFIVWAAASLNFGWTRSWGQTERQVFFGLFILFSGPIAYFWVEAGSKTTVKLPQATLVMCGGYGVAFAIVVYVQQIRPLTPTLVWKTVDLDTAKSNPDDIDARVEERGTGPLGHAWVASQSTGDPLHSRREWSIIVRFECDDPELPVRLRYYNQLAAGETMIRVPRDGGLKEKPQLVFPSSTNSILANSPQTNPAQTNPVQTNPALTNQ